MGKKQMDAGCGDSAADSGNRLYLERMDQPFTIYIGCGDQHWLLDRQRPKDKAFAAYRFPLHAAV